MIAAAVFGLLRPSLAFLIGFGSVLAATEGSLEAFADQEERLRESVNSVRVERHLQALRPLPTLADVARAHALDMARRGYRAHIDPEGRNPLDRTQAAGVKGFRLLAENIGASDVTGDRLGAIVAAWLESPIHRENLLNPAFNATGVGLARSAAGETIVVQLYATFPR